MEHELESFEKDYSDIKSIADKGIVFNDGSTFYWEQFENRERDISATPPCFLFKSTYIELRIYFNDTGLFSKRKNTQNFIDFQTKLAALGLRTLDLS